MRYTFSTKLATAAVAPGKTVYAILFAICFSHFLNDMLQAVIVSSYPLLKTKFALSFAQIGLITFCFQLAASLLQPFIGFYTDKNPFPFSFVWGMCFTMAGIILLAFAFHYVMILAAVTFIGIGSSIFHPEASRVAYLASGGKRGLAQSIFQLGGNAGTSLGPLLVALLVMPKGQRYILWFVIAALIAIAILSQVASWYKNYLEASMLSPSKTLDFKTGLSKRKTRFSIIILLVLIFSKYFYMTSITTYFTFYLIHKFNITPEESQFHLFLFLGAIATGTLLGGPIGDRFGRKIVIWISILGIAPFTLLLPYCNLFWTSCLIVVIGVILASAFSAILVFAQELVPGKVGMISGLFFGFAFGIAGIASALLGQLADHSGIGFVYKICSFFPLIGIAAIFLPDLKKTSRVT